MSAAIVSSSPALSDPSEGSTGSAIEDTALRAAPAASSMPSTPATNKRRPEASEKSSTKRKRSDLTTAITTTTTTEPPATTTPAVATFGVTGRDSLPVEVLSEIEKILLDSPNVPVVYAKVAQSFVFRKFFDYTKSIIDEVTFRFERDGLHFDEADVTRTAYVKFFIPSEKFVYYHCKSDRPIKCTFKMTPLIHHWHHDTMGFGVSLTFEVQEFNSECMVISFRDSQTGNIIKFPERRLQAVGENGDVMDDDDDTGDDDQSTVVPSDCDFPTRTAFTAMVSCFKKYLRDICVGDVVSIEICHGKSLHFTSHAESVNGAELWIFAKPLAHPKLERKPTKKCKNLYRNMTIDFDSFPTTPEGTVYTGHFWSSFIKNFTQTIHITDSVRIAMRQFHDGRTCLEFQHTAGGLGNICLFVVSIPGQGGS